MHSNPTILKSKTLARTRLFSVQEIELEFSNGNRRRYERMMKSNYGAVMIVPLLSADEVILIREYAAGIDDYHWSLPKGAVDPGESLIEGANRELMEEAGYGARQLAELKSVATSPGYMQHSLSIIVAEDLYEKRLPGDEPEIIETEVFSLSDLSSWVMREDIVEGRAIAALYMVRDWLAQRSQSSW